MKQILFFIIIIMALGACEKGQQGPQVQAAYSPTGISLADELSSQNVTNADTIVFNYNRDITGGGTLGWQLRLDTLSRTDSTHFTAELQGSNFIDNTPTELEWELIEGASVTATITGGDTILTLTTQVDTFSRYRLRVRQTTTGQSNRYVSALKISG